jgi:hypothetical protein
MKNEPAKTAFERKRDRRRELAKLPFEKKIEIVVELQKAASGVRNERRRVIWPHQARSCAGRPVDQPGRRPAFGIDDRPDGGAADRQGRRGPLAPFEVPVRPLC